MNAIHHFTADQCEAIAKVQSMRAMREAKHHWRAHYRSMPAAVAPTPVRDPCTHQEPTAAGGYQEKAA